MAPNAAGPQDHDGSQPDELLPEEVREIGQQAGIVVGKHAVDRAANAKMVADTIERIDTWQVAQAASKPDFLKSRAGEITEAAKRAAAEGRPAVVRERLKGHFIEALDVKTYNAKGKLAGKELVERARCNNPGYDASRFIKVDGKKKFAGAIQQKSNATGTWEAIAKMEKIKPGSATLGTLRVPKDQVAAAQRNALDKVTGRPRIRVKGMDFTSEQAGKQLDKGLGDLAKSGVKAGSHARALAKGGAVGAAISVGIGALTEVRALHRGEVNGREFAENRGVDAVEGATNAVAGTLAAGAGGAAATAALGTATGASFAASAGAAGTAVVGAIGGMGTGGAAAAGVLGGVTAPAALPVIAGGVVAIGAVVVVGKGFKRVRRKVKDSQQARREELEAAKKAAELASQSAVEPKADVHLLVQPSDPPQQVEGPQESDHASDEAA